LLRQAKVYRFRAKTQLAMADNFLS
jgi:hypothetical protein